MNGLTKIEMEYLERVPDALERLTEQVASLVDVISKKNNDKVEADALPTSSDNTPTTFDCLAVTQVRLFPFVEGANLGNQKGVACVVINDQLTLRGLRIMKGENGLYVGYPNDPFYKGEEFHSMYCPVTRQLKEHIENCVLEKYNAYVGK